MILHHNQFLISPEAILNEDFLTLHLDNDLKLSYQKDLNVQDISNRSSQRIIFLGEAIDTLIEGITVGQMLQESSNLDTEKLFDLVFSLSGRWVIIFGDTVISDPCALLALFYAQDAPIVSSSLALISEHTSFNRVDPDAPELVFGENPDWHPVPLTRLEGIYRKLPHQYLKLSDTKCETIFEYQFKPEKFTSLSKKELKTEFISHFDTFFKNAVKKYGTLVLPLTSGVDSRTLFALILHSGVEFSTMTIDHDCTKADKEVPKLICSTYGIKHSLVRPARPCDDCICKLWDKHTFKSSVSIDRTFFARGQYDIVPDNSLLLRGTLWEVTSFFWDYKFGNAQGKEAILNSIYQGIPGLMTGPFNIKSLSQWTDDLLAHPREMSWKESAFLEQRQSGWSGYTEQGLEIAGFKHFPPIDSAYLLSMIFSLKKEDRAGRAFQKEIISTILPEIANIPFNAVTFSENVAKYIHKLRNLKTFGEVMAAVRLRIHKRSFSKS